MKLSMGGNKDMPQGVERASTKGKEVVVQSVPRRAIPPQPLPKRQRGYSNLVSSEVSPHFNLAIFLVQFKLKQALNVKRIQLVLIGIFE